MHIVWVYGVHLSVQHLTFKWCFAGVPMVTKLGSFVGFKGSGRILLETLYFCDFSGGSGTPVLDPRMFSREQPGYNQ